MCFYVRCFGFKALLKVRCARKSSRNVLLKMEVMNENEKQWLANSCESSYFSSIFNIYLFNRINKTLSFTIKSCCLACYRFDQIKTVKNEVSNLIQGFEPMVTIIWFTLFYSIMFHIQYVLINFAKLQLNFRLQKLQTSFAFFPCSVSFKIPLITIRKWIP